MKILEGISFVDALYINLYDKILNIVFLYYSNDIITNLFYSTQHKKYMLE